MKKSKTYKELALEFKQTRSDKAYTELYNKMYSGLYAFVYKFLKDDSETKDVVMNTMIKIYKQIDEYDEDFQITTWAYTIAKNDALGILKQKSKTTSVEQLHESVGFDVEDINEYSDEEDAFAEDSILIEQSRRIKSEIMKLPDFYKNYIYPRIFEHAKYDEILERMKKIEPGINLGTVKNRIHHAKLRIRKSLENDPLFQNIIPSDECI
jgi:RNA polymerase sigma-70 factor (ECF subfamily)